VRDLILKTRLNTLKRSLREVQNVSHSVETRRAGLYKLVDLPDQQDLQTRLGQILKQAWDLRSAAMLTVNVPPHLEALTDDVAQRSSAIDAEVVAIKTLLREFRQTGDSMKRRALSLNDSDLNTGLQQSIIDRASQQQRLLREIEDKIQAAEQKIEEKDESAANELIESAWVAYTTQVQAESDDVFHEYLDFLGGLALRETGFDRGICQIADELIRSSARFPDVTWGSLTIPAREEALTMTMARIIRLGFPEWTIWALPLTAHEFGHVVVSRPTMNDYVENQASDELSRRIVGICLADAFATYVMGPAYPCAAILIRLDPLTAYSPDDDRLTAKRAESMLRMLAAMDDRAGGAYTGVLERLTEEWREALRQAPGNGEPTDEDRAKLAHWASYLEGTLQNLDEGGADGDIRERLVADLEATNHLILAPAELTQEDRDAIDGWIAFIQESLGPGRAMPVQAWQSQVTEWAATLEAGHGVDKIQVKAEDELRYVLNAGWLARLNLADGDPDEETMDALARNVEALWERIQSTQQAPHVGTPPAGSQFKPPGSAPKAPATDAPGGT
jgi:hypothetical protein